MADHINYTLSRAQIFFSIGLLGIVLMIPTVSSHAQTITQKSLTEQFKEAQERERRESTFQGERKDSNRVLNSARERAQPRTDPCVPGAVTRKPEDVLSYLEQEEALQKRFASSIESFTQNAIDRSEAIRQMNGLINEHNKLVLWSHGKVTNGTCGPMSVTNIISKAYSTTTNLIAEFKKALGV